MQTENNLIETLFDKYLDESITREEFNEFWRLLGEQDMSNLSPRLQNLWIRTEGIAPIYSDEEWNRKLKALIQKAEEEDAEREAGEGRIKGTAIRRIPAWTKWAAAAVVLIVTGYALWVTVGRRSQVTGDKSEVAVHDVPAPSNTRAVITLADGSKVYLDSAGNGTIAQQNNVNVVKNGNGEINYTVAANGDQRTANSLSYNTLFNPRGSKVISLTLSDGTKVWLNSESSLKYPTAFTANTREVEITGEAYFEVKHNSKKPFKVHLPNGSVVEDIGTAFNVNAYTDESDIKTTLIEGSVRVMLSGVEASTRNSVVLKPGQQAVTVNSSTPLRVTNNVNIDEVTAWKNGMFSFNGADIKTVMRELSRWYDVDVEYKDEIKETFFVKMDRNTNVSNVFKILQTTGGVHFNIEGKKITVLK
jgi:ferric-dicitrate binding protein FerR (iron transport regulator)